MDLVLAEEHAAVRTGLLEKLHWQGPVFEVSAITGEGTRELGQAVMRELEAMNLREREALEALPDTGQ